jgi:hypothetical protein
MGEHKVAALQNKNHHIPKYIASLTHFVNRSMNRLEALSLYGDTCLNTTVSALKNDHGISFKKKKEPHIHQAGGTVHFTRYWLADDSKDRAYQLIQLNTPSTPR